ncbi:hypothetical protein ZWY2020_006865 [Hordeum vulgare]|nr:hypothetical protein ZWY2020_006865 [Hordeum vulgare]
MDGDYVSILLAGTAGLDFGLPGLNAGFLRQLCGAARAAQASAMFYLKVTPEFGLQMGDATGPDSKKCKIKNETVRPKVEEAASGRSARERGGIRPRARAQVKQPWPDELPRDYVDVRARRGQATDSHSLAERLAD